MLRTDSVQMMPDLLARAFAVAPPSSVSNDAGAIGSLISARIASDVEARLEPLHLKAIEEACTNTVKQMSGEYITRISSEKLKEVFQRALDDGFNQRRDADEVFFTELEEHKLDMRIATDEGLEEIHRDLNTKREDLLATAEEVVVQSGADIQRLADESWELTKRALRSREETYKQTRKKIAQEQAVLSGMRQNSLTGPSQRAASLPL
jgi:hypothetical protein